MMDYARLAFERRRHHVRFAARVEREGVPCQDCGGRGGYTETIDPWIGGPHYDCGWCEGTGRTTKHLRGLWLRWRKQEKAASRKAYRVTK